MRVREMNSPLGTLVVYARGLVLDLAIVGERAESPGEPIGRPHLFLVFLRDLGPEPFPQGRRSLANVHGHQKRRAACNAHQLAHRRVALAMRDSRHTPLLALANVS